MAKISAKSQSQVQVDDGYLLALAKQGSPDAYERLVRRYYSFVRLKASSYFLIGGDSDDLIQEGPRRALQGDPRLPHRPRVLVPQLRGALHHAPDHHRGEDGDAQQAHAAQRLRVVLLHARGRDATASRRSTRCCPGSTVHDPVNQVISSEELRSLVACLSTVLSELESHVLGPLPRRALLHGHRRAARLRLQDGRQRAAARQAQGGRAPPLARRAAVIPAHADLARHRPGRLRRCSSSSSPSAAPYARRRQLERTRGRFDAHLAEVNRDLAAAHAAGPRLGARGPRGRRPRRLRRAATRRRARGAHARPDHRPPGHRRRQGRLPVASAAATSGSRSAARAATGCSSSSA